MIVTIEWDGIMVDRSVPIQETTGSDGAVDWAELGELLPRWEDYLDSLHRDVRTTVCHGDLRGANVLLNGETYHPFLIDFGGVGFSSPIMDLARLEVDLLMRAGNLNDDTIPAVHEALFDQYTADEWQTGPVKVLHVIHSLRTAFERVIQQGLDVGRLRDEIRLFHACRVATAMKMLRWADVLAASPQVRRHLMWFVLEGVRRVAGNSGQSADDGGSLRPIPRMTGPLLRQVTQAGLNAVHGPDDWPARNADKTRLLDSRGDHAPGVGPGRVPVELVGAAQRAREGRPPWGRARHHAPAERPRSADHPLLPPAEPGGVRDLGTRG